MLLSDIYEGAAHLIEQIIKKEFRDQGHYLTGFAEASFIHRISGKNLIGSAASYVMTVNEGLEPNEITWKMLPGLIRYFRLRGYTEQDSKRIAQATILKQMKEGMSTQASKRFSSTGGRHHFIEAAFLYPDLDQYMVSTFDFAVEQEYEKVKSETI